MSRVRPLARPALVLAGFIAWAVIQHIWAPLLVPAVFLAFNVLALAVSRVYNAPLSRLVESIIGVGMQFILLGVVFGVMASALGHPPRRAAFAGLLFAAGMTLFGALWARRQRRCRG